MTTYSELAEVLAALPLVCREARRSRHLSLRQAAQEMDMNFSTLSRIENGEDAVMSNVVKILRWLDNEEKP